MTLEDILEHDLPRLSENVVGGPDLDEALDTGRRRRRHRQVITMAAVVGVAAVTTAAFAVAALERPGQSSELVTPAGAPRAQAPGPTSRHAAPGPGPAVPVDFVPGSTVDEQLQAAVSDRLPAGLTLTDVYPSDWTQDTPLPDARAENATDWQLSYSTGGDDVVRIVVGIEVPYEDTDVRCTPAVQLCSERTLPDGSVLVVEVYTDGTTFNRSAIVERPDGTTVVASDRVTADSYGDAMAGWALSGDELSRLATAAGLDFPAPVVTPPAHR